MFTIPKWVGYGIVLPTLCLTINHIIIGVPNFDPYQGAPAISWAPWKSRQEYGRICMELSKVHGELSNEPTKINEPKLGGY